jgi:ribosomal protein L37AE/L43A
MKQTGLKTCYSCHVDKLKAEMQDIGVWVCNQCLDKSKTPVKKTVKTE